MKVNLKKKDYFFLIWLFVIEKPKLKNYDLLKKSRKYT